MPGQGRVYLYKSFGRGLREGGDPPRRDGRLLANFRAEGNDQGAVTGELGTGTSENSAVVQSGGCGKPAPAKTHAKPKPKPKAKPKAKPVH